jgi:hypothetical protein
MKSARPHTGYISELCSQITFKHDMSYGSQLRIVLSREAENKRPNKQTTKQKKQKNEMNE